MSAIERIETSGGASELRPGWGPKGRWFRSSRPM
jgi:hypothetical protein